MGCLQCDSVKPIPTCTTALVIGTTGLGNGIPVYVFVKNLTTGKQYRQAAITKNEPPAPVSLLMGQPRQDFYWPIYILIVSLFPGQHDIIMFFPCILSAITLTSIIKI